jgi:hypothetical protein
MQSWVGRVTCLLVLTLTWLALSCLSPQQAQVRLLDPSGKARADNAPRYKESVQAVNAALIELNTLYKERGYKACEDIEPDKVLPIWEKIIEHSQKAKEVMEHYDEVLP